MDLPVSKLGRIPEGLLSFFDIKSMGQYPTRLSTDLIATMDLFRFYADQSAEEGVATIAPFAAGSGTTAALDITAANWSAGGLTNFAVAGATQTVVPNNEVWIVLEMCIRWKFTATAGQEIACAIQVNPAAVSPSMGLIVTDQVQGFTTSNATIGRAGQSSSSRPFFLLPGCTIKAWHAGDLVPGGQIDVDIYGRIRRLRR